ncbi:hypothetical protein V8F33_009010 [Rhypophila sp. PSN 637]
MLSHNHFPMLDRNQRMRTKIMAYHRQYLEAREERRQAEYDAIGEQIFANACNWLRVPGQRRTGRSGSMYRVPTPHPHHRRRIGEPEAEYDSLEEENNYCYDHDSSPLDSSPSERPHGPVQLQRRGGQRLRNPFSNRSSVAFSDRSEELGPRNEPPPLYSEHDAPQCQDDLLDFPEEPTPEQEYQAIVRNVHQRRQVVVIQPSFPFPNYSHGEIVDDPRETITTTISRAQNVRLINIVPGHRAASSNRNTTAQTNPALHYLDQSHRHDQALDNSDSGDSLPLPPGVSAQSSGQDKEAPVYFLPSPALDLSSANLTGSLWNQEPGLSPGELLSSAGQSQNIGAHDDDEAIIIEHVEDVALEGSSRNEEITVQHVEHVSQAKYCNASTSMRD